MQDAGQNESKEGPEDVKQHDAVQRPGLEAKTQPTVSILKLGEVSAQQALHNMWRSAYPQQSLEEPVIQDKPWHLQQGYEDEVDWAGLPQDGSDWNEGRGRAHLCNN